MAKFMKEGRLGIMTEALGGASDPDLAEIRLTPEEYVAMWSRIRSAEKAVKEAQDDADRREDAAWKEANRKLKEYEQKVDAAADRKVSVAQSAQERAEERASKAETEKNGLFEALKMQKDLNANLKRIAKERANARRGLTPKKNHSGYVVLFSSQYRERYHNDNGKKCVANTWKSVLQTPYDATLPLENIKEDVWDELMHQILYPMGFRKVQDVDKNGEYRSWYADEEELCGLYRWDYKANYKTGLWEITLYHTKSLSVPAEYRPAQ